MKSICRFYFLIIFTAVHTLSFSQGLRLNEIVSSNSNGLTDYNGKHSDWIEIYNGSGSAINLNGYFLSDHESAPEKWTFPSRIINAGQFLVVFASGNDVVYPNGEIHTNFSLSSDGEKILLSNPSGILLDSITGSDPLVDLSYGRIPDGTGAWKFFTSPTPDLSNTGSASYLGTLPSPVFSAKGGFYTSAFTLSLSSEDASASVFYTLDGSEPTTSSTLYTGPILIQNRNSNPNKLSLVRTAFDPYWDVPYSKIEKATIVRAKIFKPGYLPGKTLSNTYFVDPAIKTRFGVSVFSLITDTANLFNYDSGIYVPGKTFDDFKAAHPGGPFNGGSPANYNQAGKRWEKPAHIEFFNTDGERVFSQSIGIGIHGNYSRVLRDKSLNFDAGKQYDNKSDMNYEFFPGLTVQNDNRKSLHKFKNLMLRNSGNDWGNSMIRDGFMQSLISHTDLDIQAYRPCILYVDGEYWGLHDLREKFNPDYLESNYGISKDSVTILYELNLDEGPVGSDVPFQNLVAYSAVSDMTLPASYDYVKTQMDVENYADYNAFEIYVNNGDWPGNNTKLWRKLVNYTPNAPMGHDGRWRWAVYDTDFGFNIWAGSVNGTWKSSFRNNMIDFATMTGGASWPNPDWSTMLFRNLLKNEEFKNLFLNRVAGHLNTSFKESRVHGHLMSTVAVIEKEMIHHVNRWRSPWSIAAWYDDLVNMDSFALYRPFYVRQQMVSHFGLSGEYTLTVDVSDKTMGSVMVNDILINGNTVGLEGAAYPWEGVYFNNIPLTLKAVPADGYRFVRWKETGSARDSIIVSSSSDQTYTAVFELKQPFVPSANNVKIYPNPAQGSFKIFSSDINEGEVSLHLIDMLGKEFYSGSYTKSSASFEETVNVSSVPAGIYMLKLSAGNGTYFTKVILEE
ncbi:MAG: CotH kinase family protein [Cytophagaceae bacterium]